MNRLQSIAKITIYVKNPATFQRYRTSALFDYLFRGSARLLARCVVSLILLRQSMRQAVVKCSVDIFNRWEQFVEEVQQKNPVTG